MEGSENERHVALIGGSVSDDGWEHQECTPSSRYDNIFTVLMMRDYSLVGRPINPGGEEDSFGQNLGLKCFGVMACKLCPYHTANSKCLETAAQMADLFGQGFFPGSEGSEGTNGAIIPYSPTCLFGNSPQLGARQGERGPPILFTSPYEMQLKRIFLHAGILMMDLRKPRAVLGSKAERDTQEEDFLTHLKSSMDDNLQLWFDRDSVVFLHRRDAYTQCLEWAMEHVSSMTCFSTQDPEQRLALALEGVDSTLIEEKEFNLSHFMLPPSEEAERVIDAWESPISPSQKFENLLRTRNEDVHRPPPSSSSQKKRSFRGNSSKRRSNSSRQHSKQNSSRQHSSRQQLDSKQQPPSSPPSSEWTVVKRKRRRDQSSY